MDLFISKDFYKDRALWTDKRYFRCNTPRQITDIWTSGRIGEKPPASASWGDCNIDYPREKIGGLHRLTHQPGELTPSLKVKRAVVAERNKELLDSFYL